ncbi:hypothetical protein [Enemella sp. A6]|uniref:hypothetical protein n=1 Tax=Enemella sp. A6 TaxID=3440152 RepID=UPI003EB82578
MTYPGATPKTRSVIPWIVAVAAAVVGVLLGLAVGWLVFAGNSTADRQPAATDDVDARMTCRMLDRVPENWADRITDLSQPNYFRMQSTSTMAMAAARSDPKFTDMGKHGEAISEGINRMKLEVAAKGMADLRRECEKFGFS